MQVGSVVKEGKKELFARADPVLARADKLLFERGEARRLSARADMM